MATESECRPTLQQKARKTLRKKDSRVNISTHLREWNRIRRERNLSNPKLAGFLISVYKQTYPTTAPHNLVRFEGPSDIADASVVPEKRDYFSVHEVRMISHLMETILVLMNKLNHVASTAKYSGVTKLFPNEVQANTKMHDDVSGESSKMSCHAETAPCNKYFEEWVTVSHFVKMLGEIYCDLKNTTVQVQHADALICIKVGGRSPMSEANQRDISHENISIATDTATQSERCESDCSDQSDSTLSVINSGFDNTEVEFNNDRDSGIVYTTEDFKVELNSGDHQSNYSETLHPLNVDPGYDKTVVGKSANIPEDFKILEEVDIKTECCSDTDTALESEIMQLPNIDELSNPTSDVKNGMKGSPTSTLLETKNTCDTTSNLSTKIDSNIGCEPLNKTVHVKIEDMTNDLTDLSWLSTKIDSNIPYEPLTETVHVRIEDCIKNMPKPSLTNDVVKLDTSRNQSMTVVSTDPQVDNSIELLMTGDSIDEKIDNSVTADSTDQNVDNSADQLISVDSTDKQVDNSIYLLMTADAIDPNFDNLLDELIAADENDTDHSLEEIDDQSSHAQQLKCCSDQEINTEEVTEILDVVFNEDEDEPDESLQSDSEEDEDVAIDSYNEEIKNFRVVKESSDFVYFYSSEDDDEPVKKKARKKREKTKDPDFEVAETKVKESSSSSESDDGTDDGILGDEDNEDIDEESIRPFYCELCEKRFKSENTLHRHMNVHSENAKYVCHYCDKSFETHTLRSRHESQHQQRNEKYLCQECGKVCVSRQSLQRHEGIHTKPYKCSVCGKSFAYRTNVIWHEKTHLPDSEKSYACKTCGRKYHNKQALTTHERTHSTRGLVCDICSVSFHFVGSLKRHKREVHEMRTFACEFCCKAFANKTNLRVHLESHKRRDEMEMMKAMENEGMSEEEVPKKVYKESLLKKQKDKRADGKSKNIAKHKNEDMSKEQVPKRRKGHKSGKSKESVVEKQKVKQAVGGKVSKKTAKEKLDHDGTTKTVKRKNILENRHNKMHGKSSAINDEIVTTQKSKDRSSVRKISLSTKIKGDKQPVKRKAKRNQNAKNKPKKI